MTDRAHLEEFGDGLSEEFAKLLVATFVKCHRDPSLSTADVVTRLKEQMERALGEAADAPS